MAITNRCSVLWIDSAEELSADRLGVFASQGLGVYQMQIGDLTDGDLGAADVLIIHVQCSVQPLIKLQSRMTALNLNLPLIARVAREDFELGIETVNRGITHVVPADQTDAETWTALLDELLVTPRLQSNFVFADPLSRKLLALAERVAVADVSVLLTGPTGAGKEVLARVLHNASARHKQPFVACNCAAMPENLIEDMLFGHEKGSFTGASKTQPGLFEQAQGGTIFLDEIGEMSFHLQAKLLRVLQERTVLRLGGQKPIDLDIRVIAATNRDLKQAIAQRLFREDLYYRLSAFKLTLPPLRERPADILPLAQQFVQQQTQDSRAMAITEPAKQALIAHNWPGNVRELQNVMIRAVILSDQTSIDSQHLIFDDIEIDYQAPSANPLGLGGSYSPSQAQPGATSDYSNSPHQPMTGSGPDDLNQALRHSECETIMAALQSSNSRNQAAEMLGISPRTLRHKLQKLREQGIVVTRAYAR